jgi:hypothetical protein
MPSLAKADAIVYAAGIYSVQTKVQKSNQHLSNRNLKVHALAHRVRLKAYQHFLFLQGDVCGLLRYEKLMVVVHVISGDSSVVHVTWINGRVRVMVLNLQARQCTRSSHTLCKEWPTHEQFMVEK